jgi:hypothetical protein
MKVSFFSVCSTHITTAQEKLKNSNVHDEKEMSVLEKLLIKDPDPKKAVVMAMDMMMAGIDTVCLVFYTV